MLPETFQLIAKALADPQRAAMFERICTEPEVACKTLVEEFRITPATISHHCRELHEASLIECRREGKCAYFRANPNTLRQFQASLKKRFRIPRKTKSAT